MLKYELQPLRLLSFHWFLDTRNSRALIYFDPRSQFFLLPGSVQQCVRACVRACGLETVEHTHLVGEGRILMLPTLSSSASLSPRAGVSH